MTHWRFVFALGALACAGPYGCSTDAQMGAEVQRAPESAPAVTAQPRSPSAMPNFMLLDLDGRTVRLSDYEGKAVFVNFWATWCAPCRAELPDLVEVQREFGGDRFVILGVSLDRAGVGTVREFVQRVGLNYPVLMGNQDVVTDYGNFLGIPTSFLLNARHEQVKRYTGIVSKKQLVNDLQAVLQGST